MDPPLATLSLACKGAHYWLLARISRVRHEIDQGQRRRAIWGTGSPEAKRRSSGREGGLRRERGTLGAARQGSRMPRSRAGNRKGRQRIGVAELWGWDVDFAEPVRALKLTFVGVNGGAKVAATTKFVYANGETETNDVIGKRNRCY